MNWRLLLLAPLLLAGCVDGQAYRQMRHDLENPATSEYYRHEVSQPVIHAPAELMDPALAEVKAHLDAEAKQWQDKATTENDVIMGVSADRRREAAATNADPAKLAATLKAPLALPVYLALVHARNPAIAAAGRELRAALLRYPQVTALEDVLTQYNAFTKQLDTLVTVQSQKAMAAMQFPFPDVAALKGQAVTLEVALARIALEMRARDVLTEARVAWFNYAYLYAAIAITRENEGLLDNLTRVVQTRYQDDQALYGDLLSAQMELATVTEDEQTLRDRLGAATAALNALLDRPAGAALGAPEALTDATVNPALTEVTALALQDRQELRQQRVAIQRMETLVEMATRMATPDPTLGASYLEARMKVVSGTAPAGEMAAGTFDTQPRLNPAQAAQYGRETAYIRETQARIEAMKRMLADMENATQAMVHDRWADMTTAARRVQTLYRVSQIPLARQALKATEAAYTSGKADFTTYIEAQRTLLRFQLEEEQARRDFREALARLEQTVGVDLPATAAAAAPESAPAAGRSTRARANPQPPK